MELKALQKDHEDVVGDTDDAQREAKEQQLMAVTAENMRDAMHAEAAHLRDELRVVGHSVHSFSVSVRP